MKAYTDLEQSKRLAKILPLSSADMRYGYIAPYDYSDRMYDGGYDEIPYPKDFLIKNPNFSANEYDAELPCWSLVALINILPRVDIEKEIRSDDTFDYRVKAYIDDGYIGEWFNNPVDACVEMILKLHEQTLL